MEWEQVATIIGVNVGVLAIVCTIILWAISKLDSDVKSLNIDVKTIASRLDGHATRIDQLYKMFIDLIKDKK